VNALAPGFLIAMPQLGDPNFSRAVVLMIEHGSGGSMGLVVNRAAPLTLRDLAQGQSLSVARRFENQAVFVGGPVEPQRGFILHDSDQVAERHEILPGLYLSVTTEALGPLLGGGAHHLRFCLGYSGWGQGQLEQEISAGAWLYTEASSAPVLQGDPDQLWDMTLRGMGVDPAMLFPAKGLN
jgi:putative transcriptional regulator